MMFDEPVIKLVVDMKSRRPACVILQAIYGGDRSIVSRYFDGGTWLTAPTPDMHMVSGTLSQWREFADETNRQHARSK